MFSIVKNRISINSLYKGVYNSYITAVWTKMGVGISLLAQFWQGLGFLWFFLPFILSCKLQANQEEALCQSCSFQKKSKSFPHSILNKFLLCLIGYDWATWQTAARESRKTGNMTALTRFLDLSKSAVWGWVHCWPGQGRRNKKILDTREACNSVCHMEHESHLWPTSNLFGDVSND